MTVVVPRTLREALVFSSANPNAQIIQGGTDLMVEINFNHRKPTDVIALRRVDEIRGYTVSVDRSKVIVGSGMPYQKMEPGEVADLFPALAQAARTVGSPQIRAAASIGGNLGTCSPAGDALPVLSAFDAVINLRTETTSRDVTLHEFRLGVKRNARLPGELIVSATLPVINGWQGYAKVGVRNAMVISVASCCLVVDRNLGTIKVALGAVGPTIIRCRETEQWLSTQIDLKTIDTVAPNLLKDFGDRIANESKPIDDHRSTAAYRRHAVATLSRRLLVRANTK